MLSLNVTVYVNIDTLGLAAEHHTYGGTRFREDLENLE